MLMRQMLITGAILGGFAAIGSTLVAITFSATEEKIEQAHRDALLRSLHELVTPEQSDNDLYHDVIEVTDRALLGSNKPVQIYRARKAGQPVAALLTPIAPNGYGGAIRLLVAINYDGHLAGVRVLQHHETPGLGDDIEASRSDWILSFDNHSLSSLNAGEWKVKKDGGVFDQFTGATITPRAIVHAVHRSLSYFQQHREAIFNTPSLPPEAEHHE
ncbi:Electron transport complex protein RnfG [hydrothermal vent metagenome]|uniref:Electron transport complex protein RnfG n=1 Tax=hydrothermal vent metagenome TaxID=652676 RepID=A0A3B0ZG40_9ZZZZ